MNNNFDVNKIEYDVKVGKNYTSEDLRGFLLPQELVTLEQIKSGNLTTKKKLFGRMVGLGYAGGTYKKPTLTELGCKIVNAKNSHSLYLNQ